MATIGLHELPPALRTALEQGEVLEVTDQGTVIARMVPVQPLHPVRPGLAADLDAIDAFAAEVSAAWKDDLTAVDAVQEQRREL